MVNSFIELLNRSIQAGYLIVAIIILRVVWKRIPKLLYRFLWGLVGLRLVLPFTLETVLSIIPKKTVIEPEILYVQEPAINSGIGFVNQVVNPVIAENFTPDIAASVNPMQIVMSIGAGIWIIGMIGLLLYGVVSYLRLSNRIQDAVLLKDNIYQSEKVVSPFVFGLFKPRIYLPYSMNAANMSYVITHEKMHIKKKDYLLKPLAFLITSVYWFSPLIWIAYCLFCKDLELACDEDVIWNLSLEEKKAYAKALVMCSSNQKVGYISPLAFGENAVKERIKNVLHYKNPSLWAFVGMCIVVLTAVVCFMTNPVENDENVAVLHESNVSDAENSSASESDSVVPVLLKEPPALGFTDMLSSHTNQFIVSYNGADWTYIDAPFTDEGIYDFAKGNEVGMASTGLYPTVAAKLTEWMKLQEYQGIDAWLYRLNCEVIPDEVIVKEYSIYELGNEYAEVLSEKRYTKDMLLIELIPARVYEITAIWDKSHYEECGFYGEAHYILVTDTESGTYDEIRKQQQEMNGITIQAHIKEINSDNTILISSDTDDFPGAFEVIVPESVCNIEDLHGGQNIKIKMYDTGMMNANGKIPIYEATELRIHIEEEPIEISLDEVAMKSNAYAVNNLEGVTLQMEKFTASGGDVEIHNETTKNIQYGEWFEIQVQIGEDAWFALPYVIENAAFNEPAYMAPTDETVIWEVQWEWLYGKLPAGTYRIIKDVTDFRGTGDFTKYYLSDEFEIE